MGRSLGFNSEKVSGLNDGKSRNREPIAPEQKQEASPPRLLVCSNNFPMRRLCVWVGAVRPRCRVPIRPTFQTGLGCIQVEVRALSSPRAGPPPCACEPACTRPTRRLRLTSWRWRQRDVHARDGDAAPAAGEGAAMAPQRHAPAHVCFWWSYRLARRCSGELLGNICNSVDHQVVELRQGGRGRVKLECACNPTAGESGRGQRTAGCCPWHSGRVIAAGGDSSRARLLWV